MPTKTFKNGNSTMQKNNAELRRGQFETARGITLDIVGVPMWLLQKLESNLRAEWTSGEFARPLTPPTYEVETVGGGKETHEYDAEALKTAPDEDKAAYAEFLASVAAFNEELRDRTLRIVFTYGIVTRAAGDEWAARQRKLFVPVPEDADERHIHWVQTEVLTSPAEAFELMNAVMKLSGVPEEALQAATAAFQREMGYASEGDSAGENADEGGRMEPFTPDGRDPNSEGVGAVAV